MKFLTFRCHSLEAWGGGHALPPPGPGPGSPGVQASGGDELALKRRPTKKPYLEDELAE
ncbi:hypothetical protein E2C01_078240 [Portunus trituberculatus]|uniref:Uncharacterized protein n=1 Tax=Portunus trituberculatus TaxID=210409 RepID=A0A5B7INB1_PORTR|nr:hypothetical protein [Portunus trituberculatus]